MTISNTSRTAGPFLGNGITKSFPFNFKVFSRGDVLVAQTVTATGVETLKTLDADYTVTLNVNQDANPGGVITMSVAPPAGTMLAATSNIDLVQSLDLTNQGGFYPKVINDALDRMVINIQQLAGKVGKGLNVGGAAITDAALGALAFVQQVGTSQGAAAIGYLSPGVGSVLRTIESMLGDRISVKGYGAKGDGITNDTAAILAADKAAAARGKTLFFPAGTYATDPVTATTSWCGEMGSILKYRGNLNVDLVTATGIDNLVFCDLIFDGNVTADPANWTNANYDSFKGASGLSINQCDGAKVVRCRGQNTWRHGFRFVRCTNAIWESCNTNRTRGMFGDGFIVISSVGVLVRGCRSYDFTRIGFVFDHYGNDPGTCHQITVQGCSAEYGHDAAIFHGGNEYNAGLWAENTANMQIDGFTAKNMPSPQGRGMTLCSGVKNNGATSPTATFSATNLLFDSTGIGIVAYSQGDYPVAVTLGNIKAVNVWNGINLQGLIAEDSFVATDCFVEVNYALNPLVGNAVLFSSKAGLAARPTITIENLLVKHTNAVQQDFLDFYSRTSTGDISAYSGDPAGLSVRLRIRNARNVDGSPVWIGIPYMLECELEVRATYLRIAYASWLGSGFAVFRDCRVAAATVGDGSATKVEFYGCQIEGMVRAGGNTMRIEGGHVTLTGTDYLWLFGKTGGYKPCLIVSGTHVSKDIANGNKAFRLGFGGVAFSAVFSGVEFYNTSGTATPYSCIQYDYVVRLHYSGVLKDSTVTGTSEVDSGGTQAATPTGVTAVNFH